MKTLGAFQVKTHLSQILKEIEQTREPIAITKHGRIVALITSAPQANRDPIASAIESIRKNRRGVTLGNLSLKKLIAEGRK
jgi:prevent-host-death family protein